MSCYKHRALLVYAYNYHEKDQQTRGRICYIRNIERCWDRVTPPSELMLSYLPTPPPPLTVWERGGGQVAHRKVEKVYCIGASIE